MQSERRGLGRPMNFTRRRTFADISMLGRRTGIALGLVMLAARSAHATVIVQETFEGTGCSESTFWRFDSRPEYTCVGGSGNCATAPFGPGCSCLLNNSE